MRRGQPVITGLGIVCAAGRGVPTVWARVREGRSGLSPLTQFASPRYSQHLVGQVTEDLAALTRPFRGSRSDQLAWLAVTEALAHAGLASLATPDVPPDRVGLAVGSTVGGMDGTERVLDALYHGQHPSFTPLRFHECASPADTCARHLGLRGPTVTVSTACAAGALALATAAQWIVDGLADRVLAGGADALCRLTLNGFGSLLLLDPRGCRPFDVSRTGISLGEGAGFLVLENEPTARARGARILARLSGWGFSCDAWHATAPHPEGRGALAAMQQACASAHLTPAAIDFVSAHGTGTPDNDVMEARALRQLFGAALPPVASTMRAFGHTLAASGALKAVVCVQALLDQTLPPNPGFETVDPAIGFEPVRTSQPRTLSHILSNSFGFGGNNVALVLSRCPETAPPTAAVPHGRAITVESSAPRPVWLLQPGLCTPAGNSLAAIVDAFRSGGPAPRAFTVGKPHPETSLPAYVCPELPADPDLDPTRRRRLSRLQQMAIAAARQALPRPTPAPAPDRLAIALGTGLGSLTDTALFVENLILKEERAPRPAHFTSSVHNALASQIALELIASGLNSTTTQRDISFESALAQAASALQSGRADLALAGAADELHAHVLAAGRRWRWWHHQSLPIRAWTPFPHAGDRPLPGEGCVVFGLANSAPANTPSIRCVGVRLGRWSGCPSRTPDPEGEARWIEAALEDLGVAGRTIDLLLTGANGWTPLDHAYLQITAALSQRADRSIPCGAYKHVCGEHPAASAFGGLTAWLLLQGHLEPADCALHPDRPTPNTGPCRTVALLTLAPSGSKALTVLQSSTP